MHTRNVEYLAICLHLWLAISYSVITTKDMGNITTCEGIAGSFPWNDVTQNLRKVQYFFKNNYIAKSYGPNFSSVTFIEETVKYRLRVFEVDSIAFQIDNVTTEDSGEYKIILTYTNGTKMEGIGHLHVKETVLGNFNITCGNDAEIGVCTCGNNTGSDLYTWVFESLGEETTNESKLDFGHFPKYGSVFCIRRSDCKKSNAFEIPSDEETTIPTPTPTGERTTISTPTPTGERTTITTPTATGNTIIVLGVLFLCVVIALLLGVLGFLYWRRKKRAVSENVPTGLSPVNALYVPVKRSSDAPNGTCNHVETSAFM